METTATANDAAAAGDELHALRKYIGESVDDWCSVYALAG